MLTAISHRLRLFLKSELDLMKDRLLFEFREDEKRLLHLNERQKMEQRLTTMAHERGLEPSLVRREFLIEGVELLDSIVLDAGGEIRVLEDGRLEVQVRRARFIPESLQELGILKEVFVDEVYLVERKEPMYVWDVGANVGTAALYFASVLGWEVSAYELFPETASLAKRNIEWSGFSEMVAINAAGIGARGESLRLRYNSLYRGSNGLFGNTDLGDQGEGSIVNVDVLDAAHEIEVVRDRAGLRPIMAKFDCEGAEYEIIPRLIESGKMSYIAAMVMEEHVLHGKDREALVAQIRDAGFTVRRSRHLPKHVSLLFAVRS